MLFLRRKGIPPNVGAFLAYLCVVNCKPIVALGGGILCWALVVFRYGLHSVWKLRLCYWYVLLKRQSKG
jgi:hypothetical protein